MTEPLAFILRTPVIVSPALATFVESATVMLAEPSKDTPLIVLAVASLVAVAALPVQEADCPASVDAICVPEVVMLAACPAEDAFSNVHLIDVADLLPSDSTVNRRCMYAVAIFVQISTVEEAAVGQTRTKSARAYPVCDSQIKSDAVVAITLLALVRTWTFRMPCLWLEYVSSTRKVAMMSSFAPVAANVATLYHGLVLVELDWPTMQERQIVPMLQSAWLDAVPVMAPVRAMLLAEANLVATVAVAALQAKFPVAFLTHAVVAILVELSVSDAGVGAVPYFVTSDAIPADTTASSVSPASFNFLATI